MTTHRQHPDRTQPAPPAPGVYLTYGLLFSLVAGMMLGMGLSEPDAALPLLLIAALIGTAGWIVLWVGIIAWGVRVGMRTAHQDQTSSR